MIIDWTPSGKLMAAIKEMEKLHKKGFSYRRIAKETGHHYTYVFSLLKWKREKGGEKS